MTARDPSLISPPVKAHDIPPREDVFLAQSSPLTAVQQHQFVFREISLQGRQRGCITNVNVLLFFYCVALLCVKNKNITRLFPADTSTRQRRSDIRAENSMESSELNVALVGDSVLDDHYWLDRPADDVRAQTERTLKLAHPDRSVLVHNFAVDESTISCVLRGRAPAG